MEINALLIRTVTILLSYHNDHGFYIRIKYSSVMCSLMREKDPSIKYQRWSRRSAKRHVVRTLLFGGPRRDKRIHLIAKLQLWVSLLTVSFVFPRIVTFAFEKCRNNHLKHNLNGSLLTNNYWSRSAKNSIPWGKKSRLATWRLFLAQIPNVYCILYCYPPKILKYYFFSNCLEFLFVDYVRFVD